MYCRKGQAKGYTYGRTVPTVPKDDDAIGELLGEKVVAYSVSNGVDY